MAIVAVVPPSRQPDPRRSAVDCATLRVLPVPPYHTRPQNGRAFRTLTDEVPSVQCGTTVGQPTAPVRQPDHGERSGNVPLSRNATLRSRSVQALVSSSTDCTKSH